MTDSISTQNPTPKRRLSRRTIAIIAAGRRCRRRRRCHHRCHDHACVRRRDRPSLLRRAQGWLRRDEGRVDVLIGREKALEASKSTTLAKDKWTTTKYVDPRRLEGGRSRRRHEGQGRGQAVAARPSGKEFTEAVSTAAASLAALKTPTTCEDRDQATNITAKAKKVTAASNALRRARRR